MIGRVAVAIVGRAWRDAGPGPRLGVAWLALLALAALLGPLGGYPIGADVDPARASLGPSAAHWLGTDHLGRDVAWRALLATGSFVGPGLLAAAVTAAVGVPLGALAGWLGGGIGAAIRAGLSSLAALPPIVLVLLVASIHGDSAGVLATTVGVAGAPALAEAIRERIERLRVEEFVLAAQAHGVPPLRLLGLHLVGAACGRSVLRHLVWTFGGFVMLESTLSYLGGFGVREPVPSWGNMLVFEWGREVSAASVAPALALWTTAVATAAAARVFAEVPDA